MMDLKDANLEDLRRNYDRRNRQAIRLLESHAGTERLKHLLRFHDAGIRPDETWLRDSFDYLLEFYSTLEVAAIAGLLPTPLPRRFSQDSLKRLGEPAVRQYYEHHYPLLLPALFRRRLEGRNRATDEGDGTASIYVEFIDASSMLDDGDVERFLWFLDSGTDSGEGLDSVLRVLGDDRAFVETMIGGRGRRVVSMALRGMDKFLSFCRAFEAVLDRASRHNILQSAMWHFHSYWFEHLKNEVGEELPGAIDRFVNWQEPDTDPEDGARSRESAARMIRRLKRLTSSEFASPLRVCAFENH